MRTKSFLYFLKEYVRELSLSGSTSIRQLAKEASDMSPRLWAPLFLYAYFSDNVNVLLAASQSETQRSCEFRRLYDYYGTDKAKFERDLKLESENIPYEYSKAYVSYATEKDRFNFENKLKSLMLNKTLSLMDAKGVSKYRVYKGLQLNPGNVNSFLKNGDTKKVSLATARRIYEYTKNFCG